jgi:hypothetical protein
MNVLGCHDMTLIGGVRVLQQITAPASPAKFLARGRIHYLLIPELQSSFTHPRLYLSFSRSTCFLPVRLLCRSFLYHQTVPTFIK